MIGRSGDLQVIRPIVLVRTDQGAQTGVTQQAPVSEGQTILTNNESRALLTLFDGSTVQIYPDTELRITTLQEPRFAKWGFSQQPHEIWLDIISGTVKVGVALPSVERTAPVFHVSSPHMQARLVEGGYFFDVTATATSVSADSNSAEVSGLVGQEKVTLKRGQRTEVLAGGSPRLPMPSEVNLISNGDFSAPLNGGWRIFIDQGGDGPSVDPGWQIINTGDREALHFARTGSEFAPGRGNHANVRAVQVLNRNLPDPYTSLKLSADVRINEQSLSGGGYLDTEYPMIIRVVYKDGGGAEHEWWRGFYVQNNAGNPTRQGENIPRGVWVPVEFELHEIQPLPFQMVRIEVQASGWDFDSQISDVRLIVK